MTDLVKAQFRNSEKIYTLISLNKNSDEGETPTVRGLINKTEIPCVVFAATQYGSNHYIVISPDIKVSYKVELAYEDNDSNITESFKFDPFVTKWGARLNAQFKKSLAKEIRDYDLKHPECAKFEILSIIPNGESFIARVVLKVPAASTPNISLLCMDTNGADAAVQIIEMSSWFSDTEDNKLIWSKTFSFISKSITPYFINAINNNNSKCTAIESLSQPVINKGIAEFWNATLNAQLDQSYNEWFLKSKASLIELEHQLNYEFDFNPKFSIIVPLYKTPINLFEDMIKSVELQSYPNWELILVNSTPDDTELRNAINRHLVDDRIKVIALEKNLGITENTNKGIEAASGDFVCFFDHDDVLEPDILFEYTKRINDNPQTDLLYCDEDKLMPNGKYEQPFFKPAYSIDLLRNNNYICHMLCVRKSIIDSLPIADSSYDGAQDHNLTLKVCEVARSVEHIDKVLYHWRVTENSTAGNASSKDYANQAGIKSVQEHLDRLGIPAEVSRAKQPFTYRVKYLLPDEKPLVSIIIPTKDGINYLDRCLESIKEKSTYENYEIILVENNSVNPETFEYYKKAEASNSKVRVEYWPAEFNFSKLMNFGASKANGDYLLLLNNDTEVITPSWIEDMLGICLREEVGAVGVKLWFPDRTIQHAGLAITGTVAGMLNHGLSENFPTYFNFVNQTQNLSAVTAACVMVSKEDFYKVNGFTEELEVAFNDVDFCLKLRELDKLIVYTPDVELYHYESVSRGKDVSDASQIRFLKELSYMRYKWASYYVLGDPYYNRNLDHRDGFDRYYRLTPIA